MRIYFLPCATGEWYFQIAGGGRNITSETYTRKADAKRAAKRLMKGLHSAKIVEVD